MSVGGRGWYVFWRESRRRWVLEYIGPTGREVQKSVAPELNLSRSKRREAEAWAKAWLAERGIDPGKTAERIRERGRTLAEVAEMWLALRKHRVAAAQLAPSTHDDARSSVELHVLPAVVNGRTLGERAIGEIDAPLVRAWLRAFSTTRSPSRVRNVVSAFRLLFDDALMEGWALHATNPLKNTALRRELPRMPERDLMGVGGVLALDSATAQRLLDDEAVPLHRRVRYAVVLTCGARDGEIAGLTWADVSLVPGEEELRITKALSMKGPGGYSTMGRTKSGRSRAFPLHCAAAAALRAWKAEGYALFAGAPPRPELPIFPGAHRNKRGVATRPPSARYLRADLRKIGSPLPIRFHDLRAWFITRLEQARVDGRLVRRFVGHMGTSVAERHYIHTSRAEMVQALVCLPLSWGPSGQDAGLTECRIAQPLMSLEPQTFGPVRPLDSGVPVLSEALVVQAVSDTSHRRPSRSRRACA